MDIMLSPAQLHHLCMIFELFGKYAGVNALPYVGHYVLGVSQLVQQVSCDSQLERVVF